MIRPVYHYILFFYDIIYHYILYMISLSSFHFTFNVFISHFKSEFIFFIVCIFNNIFYAYYILLIIFYSIPLNLLVRSHRAYVPFPSQMSSRSALVVFVAA